jgi:ectoine hydroxylase-related dioxygenase (phytanoyl-CoA dioxygenase family)
VCKYGLGEKVTIDARAIINLFEKQFGNAETWDSRFNGENWHESVNAGNALLRSEEFAPIYRQLLTAVAAHMGVSEIYAQALPTFRVQLPGAKSVSFHTDDLSSGHGKDIANFWIALNNLNSVNCLHLVPPTKSSEILTDFKKNQMSLNDLDSLARESAKPIPLAAGECLCFSNKILHGTVTNESSNVRLSVDFRCLPFGADSGTRILGYEFLRYPAARDVSNVQSDAISVIFQSGKMSHVGHQPQRQLIHDFANRNGYRITRETSEWHHLDHYPVLEEILTQATPTPLLIFSSDCFEWSAEKGRQLKRLIEQYDAPVHFCLENTSM